MKLQIEKYATLKSHMTFSTPKSAETRLYEKLFGESEETMHLKNGLEYYQKLSKNAKYGKGRLGIDA